MHCAGVRGRRSRGRSLANGLPDVIIGGAPRSGTTFLCHVLEHHPEIFVARPFVPEPKVCMTPASDGATGYRSRYRALFAKARADQLLVEKTSYYLENQQAFDRLRDTLPSCRFVFILREPVSRAYSNYLWSKRNGLEKLDFRDALRLEGERASPLPPERGYARPFDYLSRGNYGLFARRYIQAFGRTSILLLLYEDIALRPRHLYGELARFCEAALRPEVMTEVGIVNATEESGFPLSETEIAELRRRVKPWVADFAAISGLDVGVWGY